MGGVLKTSDQRAYTRCHLHHNKESNKCSKGCHKKLVIYIAQESRASIVSLSRFYYPSKILSAVYKNRREN